MQDIGNVNNENREFWSEPCGSNSKLSHGFDSNDEFDRWFFEFYPYLESYIPFDQLRGKKVFEVGLGMGSVAQRIAENGADYYGLDIAEGPVALVNSRLHEKRLDGRATEGNILNCPHEDCTFDFAVAIGCLHHTGDLYQGIKELVRIVRPGGKGIFMVYNAFSYRQWISSPLKTFRQLVADFGMATPRSAGKLEREKYDTDTSGNAAPFTEFTGKKGVMRILDELPVEYKIDRQNIGNVFLFPVPRRIKLATCGPFVGLDLYVSFQKS